MRKRRGDLSYGDKHQDDVEDGYDRSMSSRDDHTKDGKKCEKRKDEKYRDKYREEMVKENKHLYDKHQDKHPAKDHTSNRSDHKHAKEEKDNAVSQQKRTKHVESDHDRDHNHILNCDRDQDLESSDDHKQRQRGVHAHDRDCYHDYKRDQNLNWYLDQNHDQNLDRDLHQDASHASERSVINKENRAKKRNSEERDDFNDTRFRVHKIHCSDAKRSSNTLDSNADRGGSQQPQAHDDSVGTSSKQRNEDFEDLKFKESITDMELRAKGLKDELSEMSEIGPGYKLTGKPTEIDDDLSNELDLVERSPSSTSIEHEYVNRSSVGKNLGIKESGRRKSIDTGGFSTSEDRLRQGLKPEKPLSEISQADLSLFGRTNQGSASLIPPPPFRPVLDRPFMGSLGRWHGNYSWRSVPNQTLLIPNGFAPFQHGQTHGGFQGMTTLFPSQPLFGVRPPMGVNHVGIPYHISYVDWFSGHMLPLGWQNMMGGALASHFHGWDGNNGAYGSSDWNWNRHLSNSDSGPETSMDQNGHLKRDSTSPACKDASVSLQVGGGSTEPASHMSQDDCNQGDMPVKIPRTKLFSFESSEKVLMSCSPTSMPEKTSGMLTPSNNTVLSKNYLSKLDISTELTLPELYDQCMGLLDVRKNASIDSDASTGFLKNGSRSRQKYAATLSTFPADSTIFQKAIEHYKKQRAELPKRVKVDDNLATNRKQVDEPVSASNLVHLQVAVSTDDALTNMPISTLHLNKEETQTLPPPAKEHLKELHQNLCQMGQDHVCAHPVNLESLAAGVCKEDEFTFEWVTTGDVDGEHNTVVITESKLESEMHTTSDVVSSKDVVTSYAHYAEEELGSGDTLSSPCKEHEFTSEWVITGDVDGKQNTVAITESKLESEMHTSYDVVSSKDVTGFAHYAEEELGSGDTLSSPCKEDEFTFEWVITGDVDDKHNTVAITESKLKSELRTSSNVLSSKDVVTGFAHYVEEEVGSGDTLSCPCKEDEFTSEWVITGDVDGKHNTVVITESKLEPEMPTSSDIVNGKDVIIGFGHYAEEKLGSGDTLSCPCKASEWVITGDVDGKHNTMVITESKLESEMHTSSDVLSSKDVVAGFAHYTEEELGRGDTLSSPLICEDDTPEASDALVSRSNEPEPPILSRMHHSHGSKH